MFDPSSAASAVFEAVRLCAVVLAERRAAAGGIADSGCDRKFPTNAEHADQSALASAT
jgi:hypothetical protein